MKLPTNWIASEEMPAEGPLGNLPEPSGANRFTFHGGYWENSRVYRVYDVPVTTTVSDIVHFFRVGSHGANSYSFDETETIQMVDEKASKIAEILPCQVTFADDAGLTLKFQRQITEAELEEIEKLFPMDEMTQGGLDGYISEWDGESRILGNLLKDNCINLWWD